MYKVQMRVLRTLRPHAPFQEMLTSLHFLLSLACCVEAPHVGSRPLTETKAWIRVEHDLFWQAHGNDSV